MFWVEFDLRLNVVLVLNLQPDLSGAHFFHCDCETVVLVSHLVCNEKNSGNGGRKKLPKIFKLEFLFLFL